MRAALILFSLGLFIFAECQVTQLPLAEYCDVEKCQLPHCRCSSTEIPAGLKPRDTPQLVLFTFDAAVNRENMVMYRLLLKNRSNANGCPIGTTFFVNHEYTDYSLVNELYNLGFEIALRSITFKNDQNYWRTATTEQMMREFGDQRSLTANFANIPLNSIHGIRSPNLQLSGNSTFQMLAETGLTYDLSWPTMNATNPGLWPYTLHYSSNQDCFIGPCPTASIPGPWVLPIVTWTDLRGFPCSLVDACTAVPDSGNEEAWFQFILQNFERHYLGTRAPFLFSVHEWYVRTNPGLRQAMIRFMDMLNKLNDVFMVNANEVINWMRNPIPVNEYVKKSCYKPVNSVCRAGQCTLRGEDTGKTYYMMMCNRCPRVYPWLNNPFGR